MSPVAKSFGSAGLAVLLCASILGGALLRDRVEVGGSRLTARNGSGKLLASNLIGDYEDTKLSEVEFFSQMVDLLKRDYVDPITDDRKLSSGAIKGMVNSLQDPNCVFMDRDEFRAFSNTRRGKYEGIGVDLVLDIPSSAPKARQGENTPVDSNASSADPKIPALVVASVVPGGPADKAGVKPGDVVDTVDGHWVLNPNFLTRFRAAERDVAAGKMTLDDLNKLRADLRTKIKTSIMPMKAKDKLTIGAAGAMHITFLRGSQVVDAKLQKAPSEVAPVTKTSAGAYAVRFTSGAAKALQSSIKGSKSVTLDLRNSGLGDYESMLESLAVVAPAGNYGTIATLKGGKASPLKIAKGTSEHPTIKLVVDGTTRGAASIFALALSSRGLAALSGAPSTDRNAVEVVSLPDGSGYTLVTGTYTSGAAKVSKGATK